jgi:predicted RNase H-like HicB family nuclease
LRQPSILDVLIRMHLTAILEPAEEGGFTATLAEIKGVISEGETEEEALENLIDALHTHLQWQASKQKFEDSKSISGRRELVLV